MDIKNNIEARSEEMYKKIVKDKMMGVGLLKRANSKTYDKILTNIHDQFAFNIDVYPNTLHESYKLLEYHCKHNHQYRGWNKTRTREDRQTSQGKGKAQNHQNDVTGLQYVQNTQTLVGSDGRTIPRINYHKYGKNGHYANNCPGIITGEQHAITTDDHDNDSGDVSLIKSFQFHQQQSRCNKILQYKRCGSKDILLDSRSTVSVFYNPKILCDI